MTNVGLLDVRTQRIEFNGMDFVCLRRNDAASRIQTTANGRENWKMSHVSKDVHWLV